jgi:type I restriction enzyme S subunit
LHSGRVKLRDIQAPKRWALNGGPFGSKLVQRDYVETGIPVIRGCNLPVERKFSPDQFVFVSPEKADELLPNNAHSGDLVFTQRGTLGQVGIIPDGLPYSRYVISQSQMKLTVDSDKADANFIYYVFRVPETVRRIHNTAFSSGVPHINLEILRDFEIDLPPLRTQHRIASVLSAYDNLIENNTRRIKILEEMAQMIYREWFVNFRLPGHSVAKMVESEMGPIPDNWTLERVDKLAVVTDFVANGSFASLKENVVYRDEPDFALLVRLTDFKKGWVGPFVHVDEQSYKFLRKSSLFPGDIVISNVGAYAGTVFRVPDLGTATTLGPNAVLFRPKTTAEYFYYCLSSDEGQHRLRTIISGSAQPKFNKTDCRNLLVPLPPERQRTAFCETIRPFDSLAESLRQKNSNLTSTRDLLLPKLVSGEVRVEQIEKEALAQMV